MIITIGRDGLDELVRHQVASLFLCSEDEARALEAAVPAALTRAEACFSEIANKYYRNEAGESLFDPYHSGQYSIFLYFLSRAAWQQGETRLADKLYYLNKTLNCLDLFYEVELPDVFFVEHPVGSVIGRGRFGRYLVVQQNCTVGGNKGTYPTLGEYVWLFASASVIGDCRIGDNVFVAANALVKDQNVPDNTIVFGTSPDLTFKTMPAEHFYRRSPFTVHAEKVGG